MNPQIVAAIAASLKNQVAPTASPKKADPNAIATALKNAPPKIKIDDKRTIEATSGKQVDQKSNFSGSYDPDIIKDMITVAKQKGIDPYTFLAMGMQETTLGQQQFHKNVEMDNNYLGYPEARLNVLAADDIDWDKVDNKNWDGKSESDKRQYILGLSADLLKQKLTTADKIGYKNEANKLQVWNGTGNISGKAWDSPPKQIYGVDVPPEGIDPKKNPLFGKRIIDLRDNIIKQNPEIVKMVEGDKQDANSIQNPATPYTAQQDNTRVQSTLADSIRNSIAIR